MALLTKLFSVGVLLAVMLATPSEASEWHHRDFCKHEILLKTNVKVCSIKKLSEGKVSRLNRITEKAFRLLVPFLEAKGEPLKKRSPLPIQLKVYVVSNKILNDKAHVGKGVKIHARYYFGSRGKVDRGTVFISAEHGFSCMNDDNMCVRGGDSTDLAHELLHWARDNYIEQEGLTFDDLDKSHEEKLARDFERLFVKAK